MVYVRVINVMVYVPDNPQHFENSCLMLEMKIFSDKWYKFDKQASHSSSPSKSGSMATGIDLASEVFLAHSLP